MRGIYTPVTDVRRKVFTEVARMAYEADEMADYAALMRDLPFKIVPGEESELRRSIFLERAITAERIRLAMGLSLRSLTESVPTSEGLEHSVIADRYYEPPLINVIKFACNQCPEKRVEVGTLCQGCFAHPCQEVCPQDAIFSYNGRSIVNQHKCVQCGKCVEACPYHAIVKTERPCAAACGMDAIGSDEHGRAKIDYDKCVSCGMCLVSCPFGAISDKGHIFQLIQAIKRGDMVVAIVAPAFVNQFPNMTFSKLRAAMLQLGFAGVTEVAVGADLCTIDEAKDYMEKVPSKLPFMATSCCPSWSVMAKKLYPEYTNCVSMTMTPMVLTARLIKRDNPDFRICFVGPCAAKKLEASRHSVRSEVDFVLTFEELMGLFEAKEVDFDALQGMEDNDFHDVSSDGRGFAVAGGVAEAVVNVIHKLDPEHEVKVAHAQGLKECRKLMAMAKAGKYTGYLLEGMACPGGCVAGAGTLADPARSAAEVAKYVKRTEIKSALDSPYHESIDSLKY